VTPPKQPARKTRRRTSSKRPPKTPQPAPAFAQQAALTEEWFDSWRRANALGWDYLNAVSGLFRVNMSALSGATRFMPPFPPLP
jgi:hypothetical protein